jgi:hypothetical protein
VDSHADDTTLALAEKRTQAAYDDYLHIGCYAFFERCANKAISEGLNALSAAGPPLSTEHAAGVALVWAGYRTHTTPKEAARTRLGLLRLTKGGNEMKLFNLKLSTPIQLKTGGSLWAPPFATPNWT